MDTDKLPPIAKYFESRRRALIALSEAAVHEHNPTAGRVREMVLQEFLQSHLPAALRIGSGLVFGHGWDGGESDEISRQQDVVIHRNDFPLLDVPVMGDGGTSLFFRESVVATIEVKTNYEASDLDDVFENANSVRGIAPVSAFTMQMGESGPSKRSEPRRLLCGVFYYRGLSSRTGLDSLNLKIRCPQIKFFMRLTGGGVVRCFW